MSYEQALSAARTAPLSLPTFDDVAEAAQRDRAAWTDEADDRSARARRWMLVAAAAWLLVPLDSVLLLTVGSSKSTAAAIALDSAIVALPPALISAWGARLIRDRRRLRAAILSRAIAASNLLVALLYAISVGGMFGAMFASVLALASARTLQLLGGRNLDGTDDHGTDFTPVRFRAILIAALVMAFADALTLLFSSSVVAVQTLAFATAGFATAELASSLALTLAAALVMAGNVWGLLRLRTWALFSNMLSNVGVAALALAGLLATNEIVALGLATTAAIQLLLPVPILAAALGDEQAGRTHERLTRLVWWIVPAMVVVTVLCAAFNFGPGWPHEWIESGFPAR